MQSIHYSAMAARYFDIKRQIWEDVLNGRFGDRLPSEHDLSTRYSVSRMTLRRALAELTKEGFINPRPGLGTFIVRAHRSKDATNTIGLLVAWDLLESAKDLYFNNLIVAITARIAREGYRLTCAATHEQLIPSTPVLGERVIHSPVDGILAIAYGRDQAWDLSACRAPLVLLNCPPIPGRCCVLPDNYGGIQIAMQHLFDLGHRRIAHIAGRTDNLDSQERLHSYHDIMRRENIPLTLGWTQVGEFQFKGGYNAMQRVWQATPGRPTAVLCANDLMALGALAFCRDHNVSVPQDCSIIGFDGVYAGEYAFPALTSIRIDPRDVAEQATTLLMHELTSPEPPPLARTVRVPGTLLVRSSTTAASGRAL